MTKDDFLNTIKAKLGDRIKKFYTKSDNRRLYIDIEPKDLIGVVKIVFSELGARLNTASCVDMEGKMEILYHFSFANMALVASLRIYLDKKDLSVESITPLMKGAEWIEREIHELFGVDFKNHPNLKRLLLPDDWPEGLYPLRRDYREEDYQTRVKRKD